MVLSGVLFVVVPFLTMAERRQRPPVAVGPMATYLDAILAAHRAAAAADDRGRSSASLDAGRALPPARGFAAALRAAAGGSR